MTVSKDEYDRAILSQAEARKVIAEYNRQSDDAFTARWEAFERGEIFFHDDELRYSADARCGCGAGLAYPKNCGVFHRWDCSDALKGMHKPPESHPSFPFAFYEIKSEGQPSANGATTRPK